MQLTAASPRAWRPPNRTHHRVDRTLLWTLRIAAAVCASIAGLVFLFLVVEAMPALRTLGLARFATDAKWLPRDGGPDGSFALLPMLAASASAAFGAVLLATPLGVLCAIFVVYYAPRGLASTFRRVVEVMAGIPSVVYGFWGLVTLVPIVRGIRAPGPSLFAGILILALMILPTVALLSQAALQAVPKEHTQGAAALGLSRSTTLRTVVLPAAAGGIGTAVVLASMRAIGETMAVLMVCGNVPQLTADPFEPVRTLTANIALELGYATETHRSVLFVSGLVLLLFIVGLVLLQEYLERRKPNGLSS